MNTKKHRPAHLPQEALSHQAGILNPGTIPARQVITDTLLPIHDVENIVGLKKSKLYQLIAENGFPKPYKLGTRSVRWKSSDICSWIDNLSAQEVA